MPEPQIQDQTIKPVTVHSGGVEGAPVPTVPEQAEPEPQVEQGPEFAPAEELDPQLREAGVVSHPSQQPVSPEVVEAGVSPSIPTGTKFIAPDFPSIAAAEEVAKKEPVNRGIVWLAKEIAKKLRKAA